MGLLGLIRRTRSPAEPDEAHQFDVRCEPGESRPIVSCTCGWETIAANASQEASTAAIMAHIREIGREEDFQSGRWRP